MHLTNQIKNIIFKRIKLDKDIDKLNNVMWLIAFYENAAILKEALNYLIKIIDKDSTLWISYPKKSSNIVSGLSDNIVRDILLTTDLVDVKVASINTDWSALKFVYRLSKR